MVYLSGQIQLVNDGMDPSDLVQGTYYILPSVKLFVDTINAYYGDTVSVPILAVFPIDSNFNSADISIDGFQNSGLEFISVISDNN